MNPAEENRPKRIKLVAEAQDGVQLGLAETEVRPGVESRGQD